MKTYSKNMVDKAGKALAGTIFPDDQKTHQISQIFKIAHEWRRSHAYPMTAIRRELAIRVRQAKAQGITASRLKRMSSIRRKLANSTTNLTQIQDIGGCRAIVESMQDLENMLALYRGGLSRHNLREDRSYITYPKPDGYRSHHLIFEFAPNRDDEADYAGRRIEVQIRTRLQHSWATAVEAVGLVRGENLKAGEGSRDWLRLFTLMSSEFAEAEGCLIVHTELERRQRLEEIKCLNATLDAENTLNVLNSAFRAMDAIRTQSSFYLISYDNANKSVRVKGYASSLFSDEFDSKLEPENNNVTSVIVSVDKVENLKDAYPNYFLDVRLFTQNLIDVCEDNPASTALRAMPEFRQLARPRNANFDFLKGDSWRKRR